MTDVNPATTTKTGLNIRMPITFLEEASSSAPTDSSSATAERIDERLRARQFVREFASHRWGLFKESGFRSDYMYPPFSALAGLPATKWNSTGSNADSQPYLAYYNQSTEQQQQQQQLDEQQQQQQNSDASQQTLRGYDDLWRECKFETSTSSGLPLVNAQNCLPYLTGTSTMAAAVASAASTSTSANSQSFNLMSADPFSYSHQQSTSSADPNIAFQLPNGARLPPPSVAQWRQLADTARWHFCGENFASTSTMPAAAAAAHSSRLQMANAAQQQQQQNELQAASRQANWFEHNQRSLNKQNKLCHERSAFDVIKSSDDFRRLPAR